MASRRIIADMQHVAAGKIKMAVARLAEHLGVELPGLERVQKRHGDEWRRATETGQIANLLEAICNAVTGGHTQESLSKKDVTRDDLIAIAVEVGADLKSKAPKADIIDAILESQTAEVVETQTNGYQLKNGAFLELLSQEPEAEELDFSNKSHSEILDDILGIIAKSPGTAEKLKELEAGKEGDKTPTKTPDEKEDTDDAKGEPAGETDPVDNEETEGNTEGPATDDETDVEATDGAEDTTPEDTENVESEEPKQAVVKLADGTEFTLPATDETLATIRTKANLVVVANAVGATVVPDSQNMAVMRAIILKAQEEPAEDA